MPVEIVAIGASWGGLHALERVLEALPADFPAAVVIAQHRRVGADGALAELLNSHCELTVCEAEDKQALGPGSCSSRRPTTTCSSSRARSRCRSTST